MATRCIGGAGDAVHDEYGLNQGTAWMLSLVAMLAEAQGAKPSLPLLGPITLCTQWLSRHIHLVVPDVTKIETLSTGDLKPNNRFFARLAELLNALGTSVRKYEAQNPITRSRARVDSTARARAQPEQNELHGVEALRALIIECDDRDVTDRTRYLKLVKFQQLVLKQQVLITERQMLITELQMLIINLQLFNTNWQLLITNANMVVLQPQMMHFLLMPTSLAQPLNAYQQHYRRGMRRY